MQEMRWGCAVPVNPPVPSRLSWVVRWISYRCSARSTRVVAQAPEVRLWFGWGETGARHTEGGCDLCKVWVAHKPDGARSQAADAQRLEEGRVARVGKHHGHRPVGDQQRARFKHPFCHPSIHPVSPPYSYSATLWCRLATVFVLSSLLSQLCDGRASLAPFRPRSSRQGRGRSTRFMRPCASLLILPQCTPGGILCCVYVHRRDRTQNTKLEKPALIMNAPSRSFKVPKVWPSGRAAWTGAAGHLALGPWRRARSLTIEARSYRCLGAPHFEFAVERRARGARCHDRV